jgi:hypothetical protein
MSQVTEDVARPEDRAVALRARVGRTRQNHDPAAVAEIPPESLVDRGRVEQRIDVVVAKPRADKEHIVDRVDSPARSHRARCNRSQTASRSGRESSPRTNGQLGIRGIEIRANYGLEPNRDPAFRHGSK